MFTQAKTVSVSPIDFYNTINTSILCNHSHCHLVAFRQNVGFQALGTGLTLLTEKLGVLI